MPILSLPPSPESTRLGQTSGTTVEHDPVWFAKGADRFARPDLCPSARRAKQHLSTVGLASVTYELLAHGLPAVALVGHPECSLGILVEGKMIRSICVFSVDPDRRTGKNGGSFCIGLRFENHPPDYVIVYIHGCCSQLVIPFHAFPAGTTWPTLGRCERSKLTVAEGYEPYLDAWHLLSGEDAAA
jgi:hypothetical protein